MVGVSSFMLTRISGIRKRPPFTHVTRTISGVAADKGGLSLAGDADAGISS